MRIPAVETYATATYAGELVYGEGPDWPFIRYSASQYRKANNIGVMKGDAWENYARITRREERDDTCAEQTSSTIEVGVGGGVGDHGDVGGCSK